MKKFFTGCLAIIITLGCFSAFSACAPEPTFDDLSAEFYNAENWEYMTTNGGAKVDSGGIPYSLSDGSIKFHNANQAYRLEEDLSNGSISFMIQTSKDWQMWFRASTVDNTDNDCYKLYFKDSVMHIRTSETSEDIAWVTAEDCGYINNDWNELKLSFNTDENKNCTVQLTVNGKTAPLCAPENGENYVDGDKVVYPESEDFTPGNYVIVKVWYGDCYLQLKPLANKNRFDVLRIACIGDSITYGSNADNSYTDSYPAQLQKLYNGAANVMNFGNSGKTIRDSADDPYRKTTEYNGAMLFVPDIAIIMLGTNDSKTYQVPTVTSLVSAYSLLIEDLYESNPNVKIYMATCPYAYSSAYQISNYNIENIVIPAQRGVAENYGLDVIDMHEFTKNMSGCYADGIHPTSKGYTYLAYMMHCSLNDITPDETYVNQFKN